MKKLTYILTLLLLLTSVSKAENEKPILKGTILESFSKNMIKKLALEISPSLEKLGVKSFVIQNYKIIENSEKIAQIFITFKDLKSGNSSSIIYGRFKESNLTLNFSKNSKINFSNNSTIDTKLENSKLQISNIKEQVGDFTVYCTGCYNGCKMANDPDIRTFSCIQEGCDNSCIMNVIIEQN